MSVNDKSALDAAVDSGGVHSLACRGDGDILDCNCGLLAFREKARLELSTLRQRVADLEQALYGCCYDCFTVTGPGPSDIPQDCVVLQGVRVRDGRQVLGTEAFLRIIAAREAVKPEEKNDVADRR